MNIRMSESYNFSLTMYVFTHIAIKLNFQILKKNFFFQIVKFQSFFKGDDFFLDYFKGCAKLRIYLQRYLIMAACVAVACAMPSYIAVPADQIAFIDLTALRARRVPRQTLSPPPQLPEALYEDNYQPIPLQNYQQGSESKILITS